MVCMGLLACALGAGSRAAQAQSSANLLGDGIRAYRNLEFDLAARRLRGALAQLPGRDAPADQATGLVYLGAAELFRGRQDSATNVFRRLIVFDPGYRPDRMIFPPEVTELFDRVRQETKALAVAVPRETEMVVGDEAFSVRLVASSFQTVEVTLLYADGGPFRPLYTGPIGDSLKVQWDGLDAAGGVPAVERVLLRVASRTPYGELVAIRQVPLDLRVLRADTLPWPPASVQSQFLPERSSGGPAVRALLGGVLVSGAVVALPAIVGGSGGPSGPRLAVAGTVGLASLIGYILHRPGRPLAANIRANEAMREEWQQRVASVKAENARRVRQARLAIRAGEPTVIRPGGS
jgi:hypothetical protein